MSKRVLAAVATVVLAAVLALTGARYYSFVSATIFNESSAHLSEIFHLANQSLHNLVAKNWSTMNMWAPYLEEKHSDKQVEAFIEGVKKESGFTDFFFISRDGSYLTTSGKTGYLDLILMDIQMHVVNGYEATRKIRALEDLRKASIPILAMTANAFDEDRMAAAECGMNGFLSKPVVISEVLLELQRVFCDGVGAGGGSSKVGRPAR